MSRFTWITTRDGSPTLWNNEISEPFRSFKGAFTESWAVFVEPALQSLLSTPSSSPAAVGEFGLGVGTNWLLWSLATKIYQIPCEYFVVERDLESFRLGRERWLSLDNELHSFLRPRLVALKEKFPQLVQSQVPVQVDDLALPQFFSTLDEAIQARKQARIWFHDPFGFEVNPDGYSEETLKICSALWGSPLWGASYACNKRFRVELQKLSVTVEVPETGVAGLKKQRLQFFR